MNDCACVVIVCPTSDIMLFKARPRARIRLSMFSLTLMYREIKKKKRKGGWILEK